MASSPSHSVAAKAWSIQRNMRSTPTSSHRRCAQTWPADAIAQTARPRPCRGVVHTWGRPRNTESISSHSDRRCAQTWPADAVKQGHSRFSDRRSTHTQRLSTHSQGRSNRPPRGRTKAMGGMSKNHAVLTNSDGRPSHCEGGSTQVKSFLHLAGFASRCPPVPRHFMPGGRRGEADPLAPGRTFAGRH
jgi:hypothetical protein